MIAPVPPVERGARIVQASWVGTGVFAALCIVALAVEAFRGTFIAACLVLFVVGCALFLWAYWQAVQRSRTHELGIGGLFFLAGPTGPRAVKLHLNGSLAAEIVLAVTTASIGIATTSDTELNGLAFAIMVPVYALGCTGLWGARYGTFGPRRQPPPKRRPAATTTSQPAEKERATSTPSTQRGADRADAGSDSQNGREIGQNADHG
jgi:hypothetical protein